jgi:hypothetical protein
LDNTEHIFKVTNSPTKQATSSLLWVGSGPRHDIALAEPLQVAAPGGGWQEIVSGRDAMTSHPLSFCVPNRQPLTANTRFSGPGSRPSGPGFRYSAPGTGSGPHLYPNLITRTGLPIT